jgi:hypothetical protein
MNNRNTIALIVVVVGGVFASLAIAGWVIQRQDAITHPQPTYQEQLAHKCQNLQQYYNSYQELKGYDMKCDKLVEAIAN